MDNLPPNLTLPEMTFTGKTKKCKHCYRDIPKKATKCYYCHGKQPTNPFVSFISGILIALVVLVVMFTSN